MPPFPSPAAPAGAPLLCVVIPVFNEAEVLPELLRRLAAVFTGLHPVRCEALFIDDGSRDSTMELLLAAMERDPRLRVVQLSRNFGHQPALTAGLARAGHADAVVTMDADLQDPPELIPRLLDAWRGGAEVVMAVRRSRRENGLRRFGFEAFHRTFGLVSDFKLQANTGTFGLMDRDALAALNQLDEKHRFFPGLRAWVGFTQAEVVYDREERAAGTPGQSLRRLASYALDGVFSFSHLPLRLLTYVGLLIAGGGFAGGVFFIFRRLLGQEIAFTGFTTLVTLTLFLGGVQLIGIGVLGEYLGRIYDEVKHRPLYIVRKNPPLTPTER